MMIMLVPVMMMMMEAADPRLSVPHQPVSSSPLFLIQSGMFHLPYARYIIANENGYTSHASEIIQGDYPCRGSGTDFLTRPIYMSLRILE